MIKAFNVKKKSELSKILFFDKIELKQVTLLLGGNGVGKSSLINGILNHKLNYDFDRPTMIYSYINSKQNFREIHKNDNLSYKDMFNPEFFLQKFNAEKLSEGQSIIYSIQDIFHLCKQLEPEQDHLILLDEVDSGLSVDNVEYIARKIKKIAKEHLNIQFIISFNNYEFCNTFKEVFNMYTGQWIKIKNYDEYFDLIKANRANLLKKRKRNMFSGNSDF